MITRRAKQLARIASRPRAALDVAALSLRGDFRQARIHAAAAVRRPYPGAEKIISREYGFIWICVPKAASRSLMAALTAADPNAETVKMSIADIHKERPDTRGLYTFAFVRHPFDRALSLYAEMRRFRERFHGRKLRAREELQRFYESAFPGFADAESFDDYCDWLNTPYASDDFADIHFLSQRPQITADGGRLPDFVGTVENIDADFRRVAARVGMTPPPALPTLNTMAGWELDSPQAFQAARAEMRELLTERCKALLAKRYADDVELHRAAVRKRARRDSEPSAPPRSGGREHKSANPPSLDGRGLARG